MLKLSTSLFGSAAIAFGLFSCAAKGPSSTFQASPTPKIQKGLPAQPQVVTLDDQTQLAFNEIGFLRQSATLAMNPPALSSQDGCVIRRPSRGTNQILQESYSCTRQSDSSDRLANQIFQLNGTQTTTLINGFFDIDGRFTQQVFNSNSKSTLLAQSTLTRRTQINAPTGASGTVDFNDSTLAGSTYAFTAKTKELSDVPQGSGDQPEAWLNEIKGGLTVSPTTPFKLLTGTTLKFQYAPEAEKAAGRSTQTLVLTATSDVSFAINEGCMRPVGTFSYQLTLGSSPPTSGVLAVTAAGYTRDKETTSHSWGLRCLER